MQMMLHLARRVKLHLLLMLPDSIPFHSILFYSILFYSIPLYSILTCLILAWNNEAPNVVSSQFVPVQNVSCKNEFDLHKQDSTVEA